MTDDDILVVALCVAFGAPVVVASLYFCYKISLKK